MFRISSSLLVALSLSFLLSTVSAGHGKNAMLLQDVSTLIFTKGEMTNARRSSPVPQLKCKGGPCQYAPESAMCRNIGFDGTDVSWQCEAELPKGVKFGKVEVSCEGHNSRDDEYVLKGSCGLEYHLVGEARFDSEVKGEDSWWNRNVRGSAGKHSAPHRAAAGGSWLSWLTGAQAGAAEQYQNARDYAQHQYDKASDYAHHGGHHGKHGGHSQSSFGLFSILSYIISTVFGMGVKLIAALIVLFVLWRLFKPAASVAQPAAGRRSALGSILGMLPGLGSLLGGGNSYGNNPPPYSAAPPPYEPRGYEKQRYSSAQQQQQQQQAQGGSGFSALHGLLGGSLMGYLLGRSRGGQQPAATYTQQPGTVHHVHHNAPPVNPSYMRSEQRYPTASTRADGSATRATGASIEDISDVSTTETSTAYARTKRR